MARPNKNGLDYFPLDVDFFESEKIEAISGEYGIKGELTAIKLLCAIYRNGYYILWSDLCKMKLLRSLPGISADLLECIVQRLVAYEFFDKSLFSSDKVLTSIGIQQRFFEATKRRMNKDELPFKLVNAYNNGVNVCINSPREVLMHTLIPKVKERKVKEIKKEEEEKEKEKNPLSEMAEVCDVPVLGFKKNSFEKNLEICTTEQAWLESVAMSTGYSLGEITTFLGQFKAHVVSQGQEQEKTIRDYKSHFVNWIVRKKQKQQNGNNTTTARRQDPYAEYRNRRGLGTPLAAGEV